MVAIKEIRKSDFALREGRVQLRLKSRVYKWARSARVAAADYARF